MALIQATSPTGIAQIIHLFDTEYISRVVRSVAFEPIIGMNLCEVVDLTGDDVHAYNYQIPIVDEMEGAAVVADNEAAPEDSMTSTAVNITGSRVALRSFVLANTSRAVARPVELATERVTRAVRRQRHNAVMALAPSLTNSQGNNATENDLENWDLVTHNLRAQNHDDGMLVAAMNPDAVRDLRANLINSAAALYGATWGDRAANALQDKSPGNGVAWDGTTVYTSGDVPVGDTTGWSNFIVVVGPNVSCIEMPVWQQLTPFVQPDESRFGAWIGVSIISGVGIAKQANGRRFITRT